jgi:predicted small metal-binding protein
MVIKKISEHASRTHNVKTISPDMIVKIKKAIKE